MSSSPAAIELRNVRVERGGRVALRIGEMVITAGELTAVVGPNGSGKSTLLRTVNGLLPAQGEVRVLGEAMRTSTALRIRRKCALVFQEPLLLQASVFDNVALAPRFRRHGKRRVELEVTRALRAFRCEHLVTRPAHQLSGGEARRVCLARALVCDPDLVMLDEPFSALDSPTRSALMREIRTIAIERGTTVVLVTHDFDDVLGFANRAIVLREGRVLQDAPPDEILRSPHDEDVARLVSMDNVLACTTKQDQDGTQIVLANGASFRVRGAAEGKTAACLAGDAIALGDGPTEEGLVSMDGRVVHVVPGLGLHRVCVNCSGVEVMARVSRERARDLHEGESLHVSFDPARIHLV